MLAHLPAFNRYQLRLVYQKLQLLPGGISAHQLARRTGQDQESLEAILTELRHRDLISEVGGKIYPIKWWDQARIEIFFNIPRVEQEVFDSYCDDLDEIVEQFNQIHIQTLRPYVHETTIEILLGVAGGILAADLIRSFLRVVHPQLQSILGRILNKYESSGIDEVSVVASTVTTSSQELSDFQLTLKITKDTPVEQLVEEIIQILHQKYELYKDGEIELKGAEDRWSIVIHQEKSSMDEKSQGYWSRINNQMLNALSVRTSLEKNDAERKYLIELYQLLNKHFDREELRTLCFHLGIDFDKLPATGKDDQIRELILYIERRRRIDELVKIVTKLRPDIPWQQVRGVAEGALDSDHTQEAPSSAWDIFLVHSQIDNDFISQLTASLVLGGLIVWSNAHQVDVIALIHDRLNTAKRPAFVAIVFSPQFVQVSEIIQKLQLHFASYINKKLLIILPVLHKSCTLPMSMETDIFADFQNPNDFEMMAQKIISVCRSNLTERN